MADTGDQAPLVHRSVAVPVNPPVVLEPDEFDPLAVPGMLYEQDPDDVVVAVQGVPTGTGTHVAETGDQVPELHDRVPVPVKPAVVFVPLDVAPLAAPGTL